MWLTMPGGQSIGWASDQVVVVVGPGSADEVTAAEEELTASTGGEVVDRRRLRAVARATSSPDFADGVVALRWFELDSANWDDFFELSTGAWPSFEAAFDATILGLFRSLDQAGSKAQALLVTRYASLAEWERSRSSLAATQGDAGNAGEGFRRRHAITAVTQVRIGWPRPAAG